MRSNLQALQPALSKRIERTFAREVARGKRVGGILPSSLDVPIVFTYTLTIDWQTVSTYLAAKAIVGEANSHVIVGTDLSK